MAPNTPNEFSVLDTFATLNVKNLSNLAKLSPISQQGFYSSSSLNVKSHPVKTKNKIYFSYEEIHNAVYKIIRPFVNQYKPDVVIAINGGGSFISMLLGVNVPILSVEISKSHNFVSNSNAIFQINQWIDETSTEGLRVNHSRVLLLADAEIIPGMLNFVRNELYARSMPSGVAAAILHQTLDGALDSMEVVHAADITSHTRVCYPWNSDLEYSQHKLKAREKKQQIVNLTQPKEGYWDWPEEYPLSVTQIEKHLISDSKRRKEESDLKVSHSGSEFETYWDWEVKGTTPSDVLKEILEYEKIRPIFCIEHIEERLDSDKKQEDVNGHRSTKNIFLGGNSDYWTWLSESDDNKDSSSVSLLSNIMLEDKIQKLLSVEHTEHQLKQYHSKEESKTLDESPYWSWMSSDKDKLEEYFEHASERDLNTPHEESHEEVHRSDVDLEKEITAIKKTMNPTELLQWVLYSCQLGLIPSTDILSKLLLSNVQNEDINESLGQPSAKQAQENDMNNESYWDEKPHSKGAESYWDKAPSINSTDKNSYWDERPAAVSNETDTYWDDKPETGVERSASRSNEVSSINSRAQNVISRADDSERASVAAYYILQLNKTSAVDPLPIPRSEDDEREALAAYCSTMSPQVHVNVTPPVQQHDTPKDTSNSDQNVNKTNLSYWDEDCEDHEMHGGDKDSYWDA